MRKPFVLLLLLASAFCQAQTDSLKNKFSVDLNFLSHGEECGGGLPRTYGGMLGMGTETMDRLKQGNSSKRARWGWFSLVISPNLFTTRW